MLRRFFLTFGLAALLLTACQPEATPSPAPTLSLAPTLVPAPTPDAVPTFLPHADAIHFALIGSPELTNVWAYYDEPGADYNNLAVQDGFWPSLFRLSPLTGAFEPYLADGAISPLEPDSSFFASNVTLRPGLVWSNGEPVTAQDVAFTVNAALDFHLGLDWLAYYNPDVIYRAEAIDAQTVRFYFRVQPVIKDWQYGALQGPVVNAAYWKPKLDLIYPALVPNADIDRAILKLQEELARLQNELTDLLYQLSLLNASSKEFQQIQTDIYDKQEEIDGVQNAINDKLAEKEAVFTAARQLLYDLDATDEPTFGPFLPSRRDAREYENAVNPLYPFGLPNFDRAVYHFYPDETSALVALTRGEVNVVLRHDGVSSPDILQLTGEGAVTMPHFPRRNLRLLGFNLTNPALSDTALRQAITCMATLHFAPTTLYYPDSLILAPTEFGFTNATPFPCEGMDAQYRLEWAVQKLEGMGYAWDVKPAWDEAARSGSGLRRNGIQLPRLSVLVAQEDAGRVAAAAFIADQLRLLGIDAQVMQEETSEVLYRVFDSHQFDMAILGWRLPRYPLYLCDLFGPGNPFFYERPEMGAHCDAFRATLDLEMARQEVATILTLLAGDVPVAPLYAESGFDAYAGVTYPFANSLGGVMSLYGAPSLAIPVP